ncbi:putative carboxymethylenebutenolidase [alpha proteobacterium IMCC14465]|uniref:Putative carboxymethylenebutenolidase n=1 Tax=alpha proteobacterium IMCC14465 TaxID=1220535 RepID=J9DVQ2_9PROT|nr:putative carboxymethylenebutenolidase [alpha proteobacterium IMCC14465]
MTGNMISIETAGGTGKMGAYMAAPESEGAPGLVIIQEVFGVNDFIQATVEAYADKGFVTAAPDVFWRLEPGVKLNPNVEAEFNRGIELMGQFDQPTGIKDIQATITALRNHPACNGKVGVLGFCLGGRLAYMAALGTDADVAVSYYGVGIETMLDQASDIKIPTLLHIAEEDGFVPPEAQAAIKAGLTADNFDVRIYPGVDHGFARFTGMHYDEAAANLANERSLSLLNSVL